MSLRALAWLWACAAFASFGSSDPLHRVVDLEQGPAQPSDVTVTVGEPEGPAKSVSPKLYGLNCGAWSTFTDYSKERAVELQLKVLRRGGSEYSRMNWKTGRFTFPRQTRKEKTPLLLEQFVEASRSVGAEPLIQVNALGWAPNPANLGKSERFLTEMDAAELVTHLNGTKKYGVKLFEIDNEPDIWQEIHPDAHPEPSSMAEYTQIFIRYAYAMRKAQAQVGSPYDIKIFGPAICDSYNDGYEYRDRVAKFLRACREFEADKKKNPEGYRIIDVVSFHHYPFFRTDYENPKSFIPEGVPAMLEAVQVWWNPAYVNRYDRNLPIGKAPQVLPEFKQVIEENYPGLELAVTETGVDSGPNTLYPPVVRPIYLADLLGVLATHGVDYAMPGWLANRDPTFGISVEHPRSNEGLRPTYHVFKFYSKNFNGTVLSAQSTGSDLVNAYACRNAEKKTVVILVNKDAKSRIAEVLFRKLDPDRSDRRMSVPLDPYSFACVIVDLTGSPKTADVWTYGSNQIGAG